MPRVLGALCQEQEENKIEISCYKSQYPSEVLLVFSNVLSPSELLDQPLEKIAYFH